MHHDELDERERKLRVALLKGNSEKVKWPTSEVPRSGFKRLSSIGPGRIDS